MNKLAFALTALFLSLATSLSAQDNPVVVELYTSQGCSSCPPADKMMHELAKRDDVIALALHVDYWDYIGWKDPFGNPAHADRQRAYAAAGNRRTIYTPEMVVNGVTDIVGAKPMALSKAIAEHTRMAPKVNLDIAREGDTLRVSATALADVGPMTVHLMRYTPEQTTKIKRGENRGKTLTYANIVDEWVTLADWDGREPLKIQTEVEGDRPTVVIIQHKKAGPIFAAARLR